MVHPIALPWQGVLGCGIGRNIVYFFWQHGLNLICLCHSEICFRAGRYLRGKPTGVTEGLCAFQKDALSWVCTISSELHLHQMGFYLKNASSVLWLTAWSKQTVQNCSSMCLKRALVVFFLSFQGLVWHCSKRLIHNKMDLACLAGAKLCRGMFVTTFPHLLVEGLIYLPSGLGC